jgi:hypothetical protein
MDFGDLERETDRALKRLPAPRAPRTLAPRVLRAVAARTRPIAGARPWFMWPLELKLASGVGVVLAVYGAVLIGPTALALIRSSQVAHDASGVAIAGGVLWRVIVQPVLIGFTTLVVVMGAACVALGAALRHVALGRD